MPNLNRKDMPQVNTQNLGKALDMVSDKVSITKETIPASKLKKSQKELYKDKVIGIANKYNSPNDMKPIIISKDNHIVDGHHRWGAAIHKWGDDVKLKVYKINLSAKNAIKLYKHIADMIDETIKEIMESTTLNEGGVWTIDKYFKLSSIVPDRFRSVTTREQGVTIRKMEKDLADHLNAFWKKWKIPYKIDLNKKRYTYFPGMESVEEGTINEIPMGDLQKIDTFADKQLNPVDVVLTDKHFFDRLNDPRNDKEISSAELIGFFKRLSKYKKEFVDFLNQYNQIVAVDDRTNINIPFMKQANKAIAKTIMRKKDFKTTNKKLEI